MLAQEREEALRDVVLHYGMPVFLSMIDEIVGNISRGVMTVPLDKDPEKASLQLYAERMKAEGATAVRNAIMGKVMLVKDSVVREKAKNVR